MLTLLETGRARARMPRTLVLEPTRELAAQVQENFDRYGVNHRLSVALLIGGVSFGDQDTKIARGADVLIATPGRLLDHIERGKLLLSGVELFVIDEADRMLDMGFIPDIERIAKLVPFTRQTLFFSATMPPEIQRLADNFLHNPVRVEVSRPASAVATITQRLYACSSEPHEKRERLRDLIKNAPGFKNAIIFCNRKTEVAVLHRSLLRHGFNAAALHGDMDQRARMGALDSFRNGQVALLVASDVAARGLDIPAVSHVLNYDVPRHAEDYVHRIGRTGRAGLSGQAFTLVTPADEKLLGSIEALIGEVVAWEGPRTAPAEDGGRRRRVSRGSASEAGEGAKERSGESGGSGESRPRGRGRSGEGRSGESRSAESRSGEGRSGEGRSSEPRARSRRPEREPAPDRESPVRAERSIESGDRDAPERAAAKERSPEPRAARSDTRRRSPAAPAPQRAMSDPDGAVVGLGDHVPDFLRRSTVKRGG
jgi:superfamily II DNA/RNA helicase